MDSLNSGKGLPPINITYFQPKNETELITDDIGSDALPNRYNPVPLYNNYEPYIGDDINNYFCPLLNDSWTYYSEIDYKQFDAYAHVFLPKIMD